VFGDGLSSTSATSGDYLYDILSPAGDLPGTAAATSGGLLAELLAVFLQGVARTPGPKLAATWANVVCRGAKGFRNHRDWPRR